MGDVRRYEIRRSHTSVIELISQYWDEPLDMLTTDMSPEGMFMPSDLLLEAGEPVVACFDLPGHQLEFQLFGEVVWVALPRRWSDYGLAGMGVKFVKTSPVERIAIREALRGVPPPLPYKGFATHHAGCGDPMSWGCQETIFVDESEELS